MAEGLIRLVRKGFLWGMMAFFLGAAGGFYLQGYWNTQGHRDPCVSNFTLINPEPDCETFENKAAALSSLQSALESDVAGYVADHKAARVSVFVRDLVSKRFAGVNENELFYMASLLKLPILIGGYKLAEVEPKILDEKIPYRGTPDLYGEQYIQPDEKLKVGTAYTVRELMRRAVVYSDNTAAQLLFDYYPEEFLDRILQALGIELRFPSGAVENPISARLYANIFRSLYNSSYLTREYSNEALVMLTQTTYKDGAVAKLPPSVTVAHKFAERSYADPAKNGAITRQVHECGLVYAHKGKEPYTFCIMTEGSNFDDLQKILQDVSLTIYQSLTDVRI